MSKDGFIIEAQGVHKSYRMGAAQVQVLKGADIAVKRGEFVAIVGHRAAAKARCCIYLALSTGPIRG